jgi:phosphoribosylformylglycinamidine (FGAM) synthase PurS component
MKYHQNNKQMLNPEAVLPEKTFFQKMQEEVKILANINFILEKLYKEDFYQDIQTIFDKILKNEIVFAIKGIPNI